MDIWNNRCTLAAGFFSLVEAAAGFAAASFLANFTVPDGPVWLLATIMLDCERWKKNVLCFRKGSDNIRGGDDVHHHHRQSPPRQVINDSMEVRKERSD